ncbi:MAG: amphi-Trp domain-containing protein [Magnetococcales bacterium]|nr:amphi-Trp domain-containing protein [Magnetococcales bacterium]
MDKMLFRDKGDKSVEEMAGFLRAIADRLEAGSLTLNKGDQALSMEVPGRVGFRFSVKDDIGSRSVQRKIQIGIRWREGDVDHGGSTETTIS